MADAAPVVIEVRELAALLAGERPWEETPGALSGVPLVAVELGPAAAGLTLAPGLPCVVVGFRTSSPSAPAPSWVDMALAPAGRHPDGLAKWVEVPDLEGALSHLAEQAARFPRAAVTLVQVLRTGERLDPDAGLVLESLAYATLQAGPTHAAWLAGRPPSGDAAPPPGPAVVVARTDEALEVTLSRPHARNALDRAMRDELCEALTVALVDPSVAEVVLSGAGPAFCSGGDLGEFGEAPDPATAHLVRTTRSPARLLHRLAPRVTARLHGACVGAGIELAAVAARVEAAPDLRVWLPEVAMGLIPGAGGTVSLPRRIGRQRAGWLALSGQPVDATRALHWGLIDTVLPDPAVDAAATMDR